MAESKKKYSYSYDFPDQRAICKGLGAAEKKLIAEKMGYTVEHIYNVCAGKRRMKEEMKELVIEVLKLKKIMHSLSVNKNNDRIL